MKKLLSVQTDKWILRIGTGATGALIALMLLSNSGRIDSRALWFGFAAVSVLFVVLTIAQVVILLPRRRTPNDDDSSRGR